jgi:hypothetical protein
VEPDGCVTGAYDPEAISHTAELTAGLADRYVERQPPKNAHEPRIERGGEAHTAIVPHNLCRKRAESVPLLDERPTTGRVEFACVESTQAALVPIIRRVTHEPRGGVEEACTR